MIRRTSTNAPAIESPVEESKLYVFEPGDSTRYEIMVTKLSSKEAQNIVRGVSADFRLVTILNSFSGASYPFNFLYEMNREGNIGYIAAKLKLDQHTAATVANLLEYIRTTDN